MQRAHWKDQHDDDDTIHSDDVSTMAADESPRLGNGRPPQRPRGPSFSTRHVSKMTKQMLSALRLSGDVFFPLRRLVIIWRNGRWGQITTQWCETAIGRATSEACSGPLHPARPRQAEKRLKVFFQPATPPQSLPESASVLLQQKVLEYVLEHLAAFNAPQMRDYLKDENPDSDLYAARFREDTGPCGLKIVRWYVGGDFRPKWLEVEGGNDKPPEAEPPTQAATLTDMLCNYATGLPMVREDKGLHSRLQSLAFRTALATWLLEQCDEERRLGDAIRRWRGATEVLMPKTMGRRLLWWHLPLRSLLGLNVLSSTRSLPLSQTRHKTPQCLKLTGLGAWPRRPPDRDGRWKALTDKASGNGTKAPARKKQGERQVLNPTREVQRQEHNTATATASG
ncbi:hypothetical protein Purlil1_13272 [Purpureocillium lilacinum]|uniref:Uncharacterized protein n=1 Tax=Purpureocillium lilacinum TaxID=33203 RepID=A0ABR0BEL3_PURLI|nr:hypothetical protein Purlil1_13272 [Purpureocillium lilacinum]